MNARGVAALVFAATLFGIMPIVVKIAYASGLSVLQVMFARALIGGVILGIAAAVGGKSFRVDRAAWPLLAAAGVTFAFTWLTLYSSYIYVSAGVSTSLHYLTPALVVITMFLFMHERMSGLKWIAVAVCIVGVMLVANPFGAEFSLPGVLLAVASAFFYCAYTVIIGTERIRAIDSTVFTFYVCLIVLVIVLAAFPVTGQDMASGITRTGTLCGLYLGVFATAVPVWLYVVGTRAVGPSRAAIITTLEPVVAMLAGIALLGEGLYWYVVVGCLLVVGGIVLVSRART